MFGNQALFFICDSTQHSNSEAEKILRCLPAQIVGRHLTPPFALFHRPTRQRDLKLTSYLRQDGLSLRTAGDRFHEDVDWQANHIRPH